jgi:hypothetical protein
VDRLDQFELFSRKIEGSTRSCFADDIVSFTNKNNCDFRLFSEIDGFLKTRG